LQVVRKLTMQSLRSEETHIDCNQENSYQLEYQD
jgi:hypothetical protein